MANKKYTYVFTRKYDEGVFNNNFPEVTGYIVTDGVYDFGDYLRDCEEVNFEEDEKTEDLYWVLNDDDERTGAAYFVLKIEDTDEDLIG